MSLPTHNSKDNNAKSSTAIENISDKKESLVETEDVNKAKNYTENTAQTTIPENKTANSVNEKPQTSTFSPTTQAVAKKQETLIRTVNNREEFDEIIANRNDTYILVWFSAVWCGPCKTLAMKFHDLAEKYRSKVLILKVDIDDFEDLALENEVSTMPSYIIMLNGVKLAHYFGSKQEYIDEIIEKYLDKSS